MKDFCSCIENRIVYPILIKNNGNAYLTLYYYTELSDSILHNDSKTRDFLGFSSFYAVFLTFLKFGIW